MGRGLGHIQKKILTELKNIPARWCSVKDIERRWVGLDVLTFMVYHKQELKEGMGVRDLKFKRKEHRRIWESSWMLQKRGLVECRIIKVKEAGLRTRFGGIQKWMEIRIV